MKDERFFLWLLCCLVTFSSAGMSLDVLGNEIRPHYQQFRDSLPKSMPNVRVSVQYLDTLTNPHWIAAILGSGCGVGFSKTKKQATPEEALIMNAKLAFAADALGYDPALYFSNKTSHLDSDIKRHQSVVWSVIAARGIGIGMDSTEIKVSNLKGHYKVYGNGRTILEILEPNKKPYKNGGNCLNFLVKRLMDAEVSAGDTSIVVVQKVQEECATRADYCARKASEEFTEPAIKEMMKPCKNLLFTSPATNVGIIHTSWNDIKAHYDNISAMCSQYFTSQDIKYLILVHYLLKDFQAYSTSSMGENEDLFKDTFTPSGFRKFAYNAEEREHTESIMDPLYKYIHSRMDVKSLLPALKTVLIERKKGILLGELYVTVTTGEKFLEVFQMFERQKEKYCELVEDSKYLENDTKDSAHSYYQVLLLAQSLKGCKFIPSFGIKEKVKPMVTANRFRSGLSLKQINGCVLYALECHAHLCQMQERVKKMSSILDKLTANKRIKDEAAEQEKKKGKPTNKNAHKEKKEPKVPPVAVPTVQEEIDPRQKEAEELLNAVRRCAIMSQEKSDEIWHSIKTTAKDISKAAGIPLEPTGSAPQKITAGFVFEKTKLYRVLGRIQSGEKVKQHEFTQALHSFLDQQREVMSIGRMAHKGGSIVKLTTVASATTVHLHHKGKDDTVHVSDWLYSRVIEWLQRSGIAIESARAAGAAPVTPE